MHKLNTHALALLSLQAANVLQPLLVYPHLSSVFGPEVFGQFVFLLSLATIAALTVDYGFLWTGQQNAAQARNDRGALSLLLAEVLGAKLLIFLAIAIIVAGLVWLDASETPTPLQAACILLLPFGNALFPLWYLIGVERSVLAAAAVIAARTIALACIWIFVASPGDLEVAFAIQCAIVLVSAIIAAPFIWPELRAGMGRLTGAAVAGQFRSSFRAFVSSMALNAYTVLPIPLTAILAGDYAAGQFGVAEKFVVASRAILTSISQTLMPRASYLALHDPAAGMQLVWRSFATLLLGLLLSLAMYFLGPPIVLRFFGAEFGEAADIVRLLAVVPILANVTILAANLYMFNFGLKRQWSILMVSAPLFLLGTTVVLALAGRLFYAVPLAIVTTEIVIVVISLGFLSRTWYRRPSA